MKFEINQLSKQLEKKEQSLKTWEEMLAKQAADLKEQQAAVSSVSAQTTTVTTVAKPKLEQPIIDDVSFGEEDAKSGKLKASNIAQWGITKREAEVPTDSVPKRPAVFDGSGTPAVAFPPTTDVVTVKETSDIPERLQAELRVKDRALEVLKEQREEARKKKEADLTEKDRQLTELNVLNEDLKRELDETMQKLAKAEAEAKEKARLWESEPNTALACLRGNEWEDPKKRSEYLKDWLSSRGMLPEDSSFAVCRLKPKEASSLWWLLLSWCPPCKWAYNEYLDLCRGALNSEAVRKRKVNLSDVNEYYAFEPISIYARMTDDSDGGMVEKDGKDRYSVRPQPRGFLCCLFCPCKKRTNEIRKLKYEEAVVKVTSEENWQGPKIRELFDELSPKERGIFELKKEEIGTDEWTSLADEAREPNEDDEDRGVYASYEELGEPEVGNKYRTIFFVFEPCFLIWDGLKKAKSAFFGK